MILKLRRLFISSFRWRILINISISFVLSIISYILLTLLFNVVFPIQASTRFKDIIIFIIVLIIFVIIFLKLINMNFKYIDQLNETINEVTLGHYDASCEIEYDDELGMLAANINALANTLQQKEIESAILKENERLAYDAERNAEKQKNELITNVAHDLRTPLTTIVGYLELLKRKDDLTLEEVKDYASIAYDKSLRLQSMMDDLFEFTKIDNASIKMNINIINMSELVLQLVDEFYPSFQDHDITIHKTIPKDPMLVQGDGQLLARVFENLISNAIKYGFDHSDMRIDVIGDMDNVTVKVMNKGQTISQKDLPYLFDKFYRTDESRGTSTGGTGLGLAIAKNIVKMHHGEILVTSHEGITTFVVILQRYIET